MTTMQTSEHNRIVVAFPNKKVVDPVEEKGRTGATGRPFILRPLPDQLVLDAVTLFILAWSFGYMYAVMGAK